MEPSGFLTITTVALHAVTLAAGALVPLLPSQHSAMAAKAFAGFIV